MLRSGIREALEKVLALSLLAGLGALACYPVFVRDCVPFATDSVLFYPPWEDARPAGLQHIHNPHAAVHAERFYPWYRYLSEAGFQRSYLLWNPYENCGSPFFAIWRTRCLSPFSLPFYFLPPGRAIQVSIFLKLLLAGWCAYFAARRFGLVSPSAFAVAVAFELSGPVFIWGGWPVADVMPFFPLFLLVSDRLGEGRLRFWPFGAIIAALMLAGGDPETVGGLVVFAVLYLVARALLDRGVRGVLFRRLAVLGVVVMAGLALAAVQIVPYLEFLHEAEATGRDLTASFPGIRHLIVSFFPHYFGVPPRFLADSSNLVSPQLVSLLHVGLLQLLLLGLWFSLRPFTEPRQRCRVDAMLIASGTLTALALVLGRVLHYVPWANLLRPEHYLVGNAFAVALCAGVTIEEWVHLDPEQCGATIRRLLVGMAVVAAVAVALIAANGFQPYGEAPIFTRQLLIAGGFSLALLVLVIVTLFRPSQRVAGYGLAGLTALELLFALHPYVTFVPHSQVFPETPFVKVLKKTGTRVATSNTGPPWPLTGNGIAQVDGCSGVQLKRHAAFMAQAQTNPLLLTRCGSPLLLLGKEDFRGTLAPLRPRLAVKHVFACGLALFEDIHGMPRARVVFEGRRATPAEPGVVRSDLPPLMETLEPTPTGGLGEARAIVLSPETPTQLAVHVKSSAPGVLVLADAWYPGWKAFVDGQLREVFPVDGLFRGVLVDEDTHQVVFIYDPSSTKLGLIITIAGAFAVLAGVIYCMWRQSPRSFT